MPEYLKRAAPQPEAITQAVRDTVSEILLAVQREGEPAWWTPPSHPIVQLAARVSEDVVGLPASIGVSMPGTVPMYQVCARHRVPATLLGSGRADCRAHAPDENIRIDDLATAAKMMGRFVHAFARLDVEAAVEIEPGAIAVELRADSTAVAKHEIDARRGGHGRAGDHRRGQALRPFALDPFEWRQAMLRDRHVQDDLVLDHHPLHDLSRLGRGVERRAEPCREADDQRGEGRGQEHLQRS